MLRSYFSNNYKVNNINVSDNMNIIKTIFSISIINVQLHRTIINPNATHSINDIHDSVNTINIFSKLII